MDDFAEAQPISRSIVGLASEAKPIATGEISQMVASTPDFPREIDCVSETRPIVAPSNGSVAGARPIAAREIF